MKTFTKIGLAVGAVLASASAIAGPITSSSDLIVFVSDPSAGIYYIGDTGTSLDSLLTKTQIANAQTLNGGNPTTDTTSLAGPTAAQLNSAPGLAAFVQAHSGDALTWAILSADTYVNSYTIGGDRLLFTSTQDPTQIFPSGAVLSNSQERTGVSAFSGTSGWVKTINTTITSGNTSSAVGFGLGSVGGQATGAFLGSTFPVGASVGSGAGSAQYLYLFAESSTLAGDTPNQFAATETISLGTSGTFTVNTLGQSNVPLPAAAWLLGSGLLGLVGVGRRRRSA